MTVLSMEEIEQLTARTDWVRALAGQLVVDPDLADDVAQETVLAALQRRGPVERDQPWLAGVVRNIAANLHRRMGRRAAAEGGSAPAEAMAGAADVAARVEQQRLLAEAVLALEPPFRDAVLLRFYEGLPQRAIARRLGIPVGTVNSRLTRALAALRGRLDHVHRGDRATWVSALLPIALPSTARDLALGVVLMKKKTLLAAAVLTVLTGGLGWIALSGGGGAEPAVKPVAPMVASDVAPVDETPTDPAVEPAERVAIESEPEPVPTGGVVVRIVEGSTGEPAVGAEVRWLSRETLRSRAMLATQRRLFVHGGDWLAMPFELGRRLPLDAGGQCVVAEPGDGGQLYARRAELMGTLRLRSSMLADDGLVTLKLWPVQTARVRVVDRAGEPVPGVPVGLRATRYGQQFPIGMCKTSADGMAELSWFAGVLGRDGVARFEVFLSMPSDEPVAHALEDNAPGPQDVTLTCPDVGTVAVHVTVRGEPAPDGTFVSLIEAKNPTVGGGAQTSAGTATIWPVGLGLTLQANAILHRTPALSGEREGPRRAGATVVFEISSDRRTITFAGRALSSDRRPIASTRLVVGLAGGDGESLLDVVTTDEDGRFAHPFAVAASHTSGRRFEARVQSRRSEITEVPLADLEGKTRVELGDVLLPEPAPLVQGVVVDEVGQPLQGVTVRIVRKSSNTSSGWDGVSGYGVPTTDEEGRFALYTDSDELVGQELWLQATARGPRRHEPTPFGPATPQVRLVMSRAGMLEARLLVDDGVPLERLTVELWPESRGSAGVTANGCTIGIPDHDGTVRFGGLEPDSYTAIVTMLQERSEVARITGIAVRPGHNTDPRLSPLDLQGALRVLDVRVKNDRGEPLRANVWARTPRGRGHSGSSDMALLVPTADVVESLVVRCDGYFSAEIAPVEGTRHDVVLHRGLPVAVRVTKAPKLEKPFALLVVLDPIAGRAHRSPSRWQPDNARSPFAPDLELRVPAAGPYTVRVLVERDDDGYVGWKDATPQPAPQVQVFEGVTASVTVELDAAAVQSAVEQLPYQGR